MGFAQRVGDCLAEVRPDFPGRLGFAAWDLRERVPVLSGADREVHPASTVKVLIMISALQAVHDGRFTLDTQVPIPAERAGGSGVLRELSGVDRLGLGDLITLMIVISDNAATNAVIDAVGFPAIARCATGLGCTATRVERRLMDVHAPGRNATSAHDQARVLDELATGRALPPALTERALRVLSRQQVRDRLPALLPKGVRCWNKTGEIAHARHDVALVGDHRPRAVVAVLVDELADDRAAHRLACDRIAELGLRVFRALD